MSVIWFVLGFIWLVGLMGFLKYLIQVTSFICLSLFTLCFTSIIIKDVAPFHRKQKSPSYFLLDCQDFHLKHTDPIQVLKEFLSPPEFCIAKARNYPKQQVMVGTWMPVKGSLTFCSIGCFSFMLM